jgi:hypothetical protein
MLLGCNQLTEYLDLYQIRLHQNYSSLYSLPLCPLRSLRLNHSDATVNDIKQVCSCSTERNLELIFSLDLTVKVSKCGAKIDRLS